MRKHINLILLNLGFFTRIPVFQWAKYSDEEMAQSRRYFALTGLLLAGLLIGLYTFLSPFLPSSVVVVLLMTASVLLTGALHEDGLADVADAFGGGQDKAHKLAIMKDSRLGTYGTLAIGLVLLTKFAAFEALIEAQRLPIALLTAYAVSRAFALLHIGALPYVSSSQSSKSGPVAWLMQTQDWLVLFATAGICVVWLSWWECIAIALACGVLFFALNSFMKRHIEGFTGDTLGAAQQVQEVAIYVVLLANS